MKQDLCSGRHKHSPPNPVPLRTFSTPHPFLLRRGEGGESPRAATCQRIGIVGGSRAPVARGRVPKACCTTSPSMLCDSKMAAPMGGPGVAAESDSESSSSDAEDLERFREAVWDLAGQHSAVVQPESGGGGFGKDKLLSVQPSLRQKVDDHDKDGNELQTTPAFRAHVAKKLGAMLDSCITVLEDSSAPVQTSMQTDDSEDDGFRLFSSSVPGDCGESKCPLSVKRPQPSSSSELDSDQEWQRYQEAAVSAADILKQSALSVVPQDSSQTHNQECTEHNQKKKRKKKARGEHDSEQKTAGCGQICNKTLWSMRVDRECQRQEGRCTEDAMLPRVVKEKKKKKKKKTIRKEVNDNSTL
ncbi:protein CUSTOS isoform X2 [Emydura macquarii macquarii]|uniref:protein CUSTOS isoform X2 n=1 Tax=Emydura macquarii macquarii TaxID=1129001 RepID=UPI00352AF804